LPWASDGMSCKTAEMAGNGSEMASKCAENRLAGSELGLAFGEMKFIYG